MTQKKDQFNNRQASRRAKKKERAQRKTQYAEITIAALTGEISAEHLYSPPTQPYRGSTTGIWKLDQALENLANGGYVLDLRPLADHPKIASWAFQAPMPDGRIEGEEIDRLSAEARQAAGEMISGFQGDYRRVAALASERFGEPIDGSAGPFDFVSTSYRAVWWGSRGARIGKRVGNTLYWSDGSQQKIGRSRTQKVLDSLPTKHPQDE